MKTMILDAVETYKEVLTRAITHKSDAPQKINLEIGQCTPQGDLYIMRVENLPNVTATKQQLQLVPGRTMGSRHCLDSLKDITLHGLKDGSVLDGAVIEAKREFTICHPEHGDKILSPGIYRTGYQKAYSQELRRRMD
jgi:hypothetical protein